jgi:hypothetical protein
MSDRDLLGHIDGIGLRKADLAIPLRAKTVAAAVLLAVVAGAAQVRGHAGHGSGRVSRPTPEEQAAFAAAKPAFERHCFRCHTTAGKRSKRKALEHMSMDRYPFGGHHSGEAGAAIRKVLGIGGATKPTMPSDDPGSVTGDDLAKIEAWTKAFDRAHTHETSKPKETTDAH